MIFIFKSFLGNHSYNQTVDVNKSKVFVCCRCFKLQGLELGITQVCLYMERSGRVGDIIQTLFINELFTQQVQMAGAPGNLAGAKLQLNTGTAVNQSFTLVVRRRTELRGRWTGRCWPVPRFPPREFPPAFAPSAATADRLCSGIKESSNRPCSRAKSMKISSPEFWVTNGTLAMAKVSLELSETRRQKVLFWVLRLTLTKCL